MGKFRSSWILSLNPLFHEEHDFNSGKTAWNRALGPILGTRRCVHVTAAKLWRQHEGGVYMIENEAWPLDERNQTVGYETWQNVDAGNCMNLNLDGKMDVLRGEHIHWATQTELLHATRKKLLCACGCVRLVGASNHAWALW
jgi:hypothetical protein